MRGLGPCVVALAFACAVGAGCARQEMSLQKMSPQPATAAAAMPSERGPSRAARPLWPSSSRSQPKNHVDRVYHATFYAREKSKRDPDGAIADLVSALGRWPDYDAEFHVGIAMALNQKIFRSPKTSDERVKLHKRKLEHLEKALACIDAGGKWTWDHMGTRTRNLKQSIEQARIAVERLGHAPPASRTPDGPGAAEQRP